MGRGLTPTLRRGFLGGLAVLVPIILTAKALHWLFAFLDGLAQPLAQAMAGRPIAGLGFVLTLAVVWLTGLLFSLGPLKRALDGIGELIDVVPIVGTVYGTTKKVLAGFASESQAGFQRFVLARLPGRMMPGFLTGQFVLERPDGTEERLCTVYIPTNHLYVGDVVLLPAADVFETDLSLEDGIGLVLSAGASVPARIRPAPPVSKVERPRV